MLPWRCLCISYAKTTSGQQKAKNLDVPWRANAFWFSGRASYSKMKCAWQSGKKLKSKHPKDSTASSHAPRSMIPDVIYIEARAAPHRHTSLARIPLPKCSHLGTSEFSRNGFDFRTWEYSNYTWLVGNLACCEDAAWYHTTSAQHCNALCFCPGFAAKIKIMERSCTTFSGSSGMLHQPVMAVPFKSEWPFPSSLKWGNSPRQYVRISHTSADTHRMKASSHSMLATNAPHTYRDR